jgi:hypothetical protein
MDDHGITELEQRLAELGAAEAEAERVRGELAAAEATADEALLRVDELATAREDALAADDPAGASILRQQTARSLARERCPSKNQRPASPLA